jgi:hypothetical protein
MMPLWFGSILLPGLYISPFHLMLTWLWFNGLSLRNVMRRWSDFWTIHFIMRIVVKYCRQASCTFATMISQVFYLLRLNFWRMWQSWWTGASSSTRCGTYASVFFFLHFNTRFTSSRNVLLFKMLLAFSYFHAWISIWVFIRIVSFLCPSFTFPW